MSSRALKLSPLDAAFRAMFLEHSRYVMQTLLRLGVHERDVEDEAHEFFLTVHRKFADYDPARPIKPWLVAFAVHVASSYRGRARVRREVAGTHHGGASVDAAADTQPAPDEELEAKQRRRIVFDAIDRIENFDQRVVFVLHEIDDLSIPEVADILGVPVGTAYTRLRAARELFRAAVLDLDDTIAARSCHE